MYHSFLSLKAWLYFMLGLLHSIYDDSAQYLLPPRSVVSGSRPHNHRNLCPRSRLAPSMVSASINGSANGPNPPTPPVFQHVFASPNDALRLTNTTDAPNTISTISDNLIGVVPPHAAPACIPPRSVTHHGRPYQLPPSSGTPLTGSGATRNPALLASTSALYHSTAIFLYPLSFGCVSSNMSPASGPSGPCIST